MLNRILATAIVADAMAGVFVFSAHIVKMVPRIIAAEVYENASPAPNPTHGVAQIEAQTKPSPVSEHSHEEEE